MNELGAYDQFENEEEIYQKSQLYMYSKPRILGRRLGLALKMGIPC